MSRIFSVSLSFPLRARPGIFVVVLLPISTVRPLIQLLLLLLRPLPHQLPAAPIAQRNLNQCRLVLAILDILEGELKDLERGPDTVRASFDVQRTSCVAACGLSCAGNDFGLCPPPKRKLQS